MEPKKARNLLDQRVVSKTGKLFGRVGDIIFESKSGELVHIVLKDVTDYAKKLNLERDEKGRYLLPFSAVEAMEDFLIINEEDIL